MTMRVEVCDSCGYAYSGTCSNPACHRNPDVDEATKVRWREEAALREESEKERAWLRRVRGW